MYSQLYPNLRKNFEKTGGGKSISMPPEPTPTAT